MNLTLKLITFMLLNLFSIGCAHSKDRVDHRYPIQMCERVSAGELNLEDVNGTDAHINSYLFSCAVSIFIHPVSLNNDADLKTKQRENTRNQNKAAIADHFLSRPLDLDYQDKEGDSLLMSIILSYLPEAWKEKAVNELVNRGVNLEAKNDNGNTALELATFDGNERIIKDG